ncbi:MAG: DUF2341 domain-containing protein, partial [Kiritimatiellae bacterium]|nr:DUF2341 domain-containing protein [Kiritimatiellia bacterium]
MKTAKSLAILALAVAAAQYPTFGEQLAAGKYAKSMNVVFPGVKEGVSLTNFPALVRLSTSIAGFRYADFSRPNGGDLRFADANGNLIPHEIDTWNPNGVSTVWVKVPRLEKNVAITAHYGFTGSGNPQSVAAKDVWDDDYVGVWHLGESELPLKESSATSSDFDSQHGTGVDYAAEGVVGGSVEFSGDPRNSVVAPDHDALDGFSRFTIEVWTFQDELFAGAGILSKRTSSKSNVAYSVDNQLGSGNARRTVLTAGTSTTAAGVWSSTLTPTFGEWNHYAYTVDMASKSASVRNVCGYLNGACPTTARFVYANTMPNCASDLYLGNLDAAATPSFKGRIDEVRISKTVRSADWILATHDTIANVGFSVCVFGEVDYGENVANMLLKASTDKANPIDYVENEPVKFNFRIDGITNTLPLEVRAKEPLCVIWERTADDGVRVKGTNTISLAGGCTVTTSLAVPGVIRMDAYLAGSDFKAIEYYDASNTKKNITFGGGAGVATERMQMSTVEPADFDAFWARAKAKLAAVQFNDSNVELTPVTPVGASSYTLRTFNFYAAKVPCVGSTGYVTGWLVIPKNAQPGSLPARVYFDGYSATIRVPTPPAFGVENTIVFRVNAHGYDLVGRSSSYYLNFANTINHTGEVPLRETYALEASDYEDPEDTYLYYMALRAVRAFDYLKTRPEWDGKNLIAIGGSQGGLQTMWAGGLVDGISEIKPYITWGCDIGDPFIDKDHPWPTQSPLLSRTWGIPNTPNAYYFDAALHAKRVPVNCVATITRIGLGDKPCPMRGVLLSYYNMPCAVKEATLVQGADHLDDSIPPQPNQVYTISNGAAPEGEPVEVGPGGNIEDLFLKARTDKGNPIDYAENEAIRFNFNLGGVEALPTALQNKPLYVIWERTADDNVKVVGTNAITFAAGCSVVTRLAVPGIVRMDAYLAGSDYKAIEKSGGKKIAFGGSAGVAAEKMRISTVEPADFDAFWADAKAKLATVPFPTDGSELTEVFPSSSATSSYRFYAAKIPCYGPRPVTGWLVVPKNAQPGTLPIQAQFDGYGCIASRPSLPTFGQGQRVSFLVNAHGYEMVGHDDQYYRGFYNSTKGYALSASEYATPANAYLYYMALRVMRAYEYLKSRPEWNGKDIESLGGSQGGLQAMWAGGLVDGITKVNTQITWGCDIANPYLGSYPNASVPRIPNVSGAYYFDAVLHAKRIPRTCDVDIMRVGMGDKTSPARGVLLSYYNVKCKASAKLVQGSDHDKSTVPNPPYQEYTISKETAADDPTPSDVYGPLATDLYAKSLSIAFPGVQEGVTLTDFPALVRLSTEIDGFRYADFAMQNGGDLRFADANGNLIPHEIDTWNPNGVSTVWVKVPQ